MRELRPSGSARGPRYKGVLPTRHPSQGRGLPTTRCIRAGTSRPMAWGRTGPCAGGQQPARGAGERGGQASGLQHGGPGRREPGHPNGGSASFSRRFGHLHGGRPPRRPGGELQWDADLVGQRCGLGHQRGRSVKWGAAPGHEGRLHDLFQRPHRRPGPVPRHRSQQSHQGRHRRGRSAGSEPGGQISGKRSRPR